VQFPKLVGALLHEDSKHSEGCRSLGGCILFLAWLSMQAEHARVKVHTANQETVVHASKFIVPLFFLVYKEEAGHTILWFKSLSFAL
jgi:hypothetical protein